MKATCCWCGKHFVRLGDHYWCKSEACRQKQVAFAITFEIEGGRIVPFYIPLPKQVDFDCFAAPHMLGGGAAGVSKSTMARMGAYRRALAIPDFEALILRKTWNELEKHHLRLMERETARMRALGLNVTFSKTDREMRFHFPGGAFSVIEGGHMENPEDVDKYLSRERDMIVPDEGSTFDPQKLLELSTRARSSKPQVAAWARKFYNKWQNEPVPRGGAKFWVLSNPGGPAAGMLRDFCIDHTPNFDEYPQLGDLDSEGKPLYRPDEWGYIPGNLEDNPYLPESYERDLAVLPPWRYQQLRFNNWDVISGQFFVEFDARTHVHDLGTPGHVQWFRSKDYGFIQPGVCLWWAILPDGLLYIRKEYKFQYTSIPDIALEMRRITRNLRIERISYTVADKYSMGTRTSTEADQGETRGETFERNGIPIIGANHERQNGWTRVRELLALRPDGKPTLIIHPECRYLIRCLAAAVSDKNNPEDVDTNCEDHPLDALRFGAMSRPSPRLFSMPALPKNSAGQMMEDARLARPRSPYSWR